MELIHRKNRIRGLVMLAALTGGVCASMSGALAAFALNHARPLPATGSLHGQGR